MITSPHYDIITVIVITSYHGSSLNVVVATGNLFAWPGTDPLAVVLMVNPNVTVDSVGVGLITPLVHIELGTGAGI